MVMADSGADAGEAVAVAGAEDAVMRGPVILWYGNRCVAQKHRLWVQNRKQAGNQASIDIQYHFSAAGPGRTISGTIIIG
jgi:hypothetical protein